MPKYNSLLDGHLAGHFDNRKYQKHLLRQGLITGDGRLIPSKSQFTLGFGAPKEKSPKRGEYYAQKSERYRTINASPSVPHLQDSQNPINQSTYTKLPEIRGGKTNACYSLNRAHAAVDTGIRDKNGKRIYPKTSKEMVLMT